MKLSPYMIMIISLACMLYGCGRRGALEASNIQKSNMSTSSQADKPETTNPAVDRPFILDSLIQ